ncbi:MAG TPA: SIS domain-containing protein [Terriglobales bacterium]|nr:SIS domain-containing protein [Terriglobales bacterium]
MSDEKAVDSSTSSPPPGAYSLAEILSQPRFWGQCLEALEREGSLAEVRRPFASATEWLFVGCGSSYYIALSAAASWSAITGMRARAVPASELLLFPEPVLAGSENLAAAVISRSGQTSEAVQAAQLLERERNIRTLAVTGTPDQALEQSATATLPLLPCGEQSTVMTRSFTSMLLGLQYLAGQSGDRAFAALLGKLPALAEKAMSRLHPQIRDFVESRQFADYVCLGQGPFYGLACETALKITEMSVSYAQSFHTLEFRHGPKSIVGPETLVVFLLSESGYDAECDVLTEVKRLGGTTLAIANRAGQRARAASDLLLEFDFVLPELARLAPYVFAGQLAGLYTGLKKGLDPDRPRHLSRVVVLDDEESRRSEPASRR